MLVPVKTSGALPALFVLHGRTGRLHLAASLLETLGSDQPIYAIMPEGWNGQAPVTNTMKAMISAYAAQVRATAPKGPVRVLALCGGSLAGIELVRTLTQEGRLVGPPILI